MVTCASAFAIRRSQENVLSASGVTGSVSSPCTTVICTLSVVIPAGRRSVPRKVAVSIQFHVIFPVPFCESRMASEGVTPSLLKRYADTMPPPPKGLSVSFSSVYLSPKRTSGFLTRTLTAPSYSPKTLPSRYLIERGMTICSCVLRFSLFVKAPPQIRWMPLPCSSVSNWIEDSPWLK